MTKQWFACLAIAIGLAACTGEAEKLQQQYDMMERAGASGEELCSQAQKVATAYLEAGDEKFYEISKKTADLQCLTTRLKRENL